jgi:cellobiose-specific phosphotransferase system component IIC
MSALAYLSFALVPSSADLAPVLTVILTFFLGAAGLFLWQSPEALELSPLEWTGVAGIFIGMSVALFFVACWERGISLSLAITFPPSLWDQQETAYGYFFTRSILVGLSVLLLGIGSIVRWCVLIIATPSNIAVKTAPSGRLDGAKARRLLP